MIRPLAAAFGLLVGSAAHALDTHKPLWELGAGGASISFPDYRGSDHQQVYALPFPYLIYRGESLRVDRDGLRGLLYDTERLWLDISLDGAVPVDSDQNGARAGMPDLDPVLELGPSLGINVSRGPGHKLDLRVPLRAAVSSDFSSLRHQGWLLYPHLTLAAGYPWRVSISAGPLYATEGYHDYYYSVPERYATAERPAYDAPGGYSGARVSLSATRRFSRFWLGGFLRYDELSGAAFADSPLVRQEYSVMAGFSLARVFSQSQRRVLVTRKPSAADGSGATSSRQSGL